MCIIANYVISLGTIYSTSLQNPVQKWSPADIDASYTEKGKHVHVEILGTNPINLHFNAGSKDTAEQIIEKLDSSKAAAKAAAVSTSSPTTPLAEEPNGRPEGGASPKPKKNGVSVHFATSPPSIISPREESGESDAEDYIAARDERPKNDGQEWATVLYDFTADGDDELSVQEGDRLVVLERDSDDWWKVRDSLGHEGVVPASYVEVDETKVSRTSWLSGVMFFNNVWQVDAVSGNDDEAAARDATARAEEETIAQQAVERKRAEQERKAKIAAEAAEVERKRREREREKERERKAKEEEERRRSEEHEKREKERRRAEREREKTARQSEDRRPRQSSDKPRKNWGIYI